MFQGYIMIRVIVAEDELDLRNLIKIILRAHDYSVETVSNGKEAYQLIKETYGTDKEFSILITDIQMPELNGIDLVKKLKRESISINTLAMTGFGDKQIVVELINSGCSQYIDKPFTEDELIGIVNTLRHDIRKKESLKKIAQQSIDFKYQSLQDQVEAAKKIYDNLIRFDKDSIPAKIAIKNNPKRDLGGDYFSIKKVENGFVLFIADVSGHDFGASFYTILLKTFFEEYCTHIEDDFHNFFYSLNATMVSSNQERMITGQVVYWNFSTNTLLFQNAGHPPAITVSQCESRISQLFTDQNVLGILPEISYETIEKEFCLGDRFFFYTDGLSDLTVTDGSSGEKTVWGIEGIENSVTKSIGATLENVTENIWSDGFSFSHHKSDDDVLLIGVEIGGNNV